MRIVIALGGNAMTSPDGRARPEDQRDAVERAAGPIADLIAAGHEVMLTHGNGPQVGNLLQKNELAAAVVPPVPLDWCGAQTQATIGMLLMNALDAALAQRGLATRTATLVSRTLVDPADPAFVNPTKPIGRYLNQDEADPLMGHGEHFVEIAGRGWRRVVGSPEPVQCLDAPAADSLLARGYLVVASGGGGVPTVRRVDGTLEGVEAVIDKDLTAALVATHLQADVLVIATDVDSVVLDWGTSDARDVGEVDTSQMRAIAGQQQFAAGSMGPKVEAVTRFAERSGGTGIITSLDRLSSALAGDSGTRVTPVRS
jgi:carbamate kinase